VENVHKALEEKKYNVLKSESALMAKTRVDITEEKVAHQIIRLIERLEDLDDVQNVYTNADFSEEFASSYE
jgi:transcriptional/translational regulatory protein YebC/TACO1